MAVSYLVREEDGTSKLTLEEASGSLLKEESSGTTPDGAVEAWDTTSSSDQHNSALRAPTAGGVGIGAGTFDPGDYGGITTSLVVSNGDAFGYDAGHAPALIGGSGTLFIPVLVETELDQNTDGGLGAVGVQSDVAMKGTHTAIGLIGISPTAYFLGTKTATAGNQLSEGAIGTQSSAVSDETSTGDLQDLVGVVAQAALNGPNVINHTVSGTRSYATIGVAAAGVASVRVINGYYAKVGSSGRTAAESHGLQVDIPDGPQYISVIYGIRVQSQTGGGVSYGISVEGGNNQFLAGAATEVPMLVKGFASQSANLLEVRNSSGTLLHAVSPSGVVTLPSGVLDIVGSGAPAVAAPVGSTYHRTDGGAGTSFYVKESGTGTTGWVGK